MERSPLILPAMAALAVALALPQWGFGKEEDGGSEDEIRQKEREVAANAQEGKRLFDLEMNGKIVLNLELAAQAKQDGVEGKDLGHVVSDKGRAYILRVQQPGTLEVLKKNNGKVVSLVGRVEVEGKYFVVGTVIEHQTKAPPMRRKMNGL